MGHRRNDGPRHPRRRHHRRRWIWWWRRLHRCRPSRDDRRVGHQRCRRVLLFQRSREPRVDLRGSTCLCVTCSLQPVTGKQRPAEWLPVQPARRLWGHIRTARWTRPRIAWCSRDQRVGRRQRTGPERLHIQLRHDRTTCDRQECHLRWRGLQRHQRRLPLQQLGADR